MLGDLRAEQLDAEQRQDLGTVAQLFRERGHPAIKGSRKVKSQSGMLSKVGTTSWPALQVPLAENMFFLQIASLVLCILERSIVLLKAALMEARADRSGPIELKGYKNSVTYGLWLCVEALGKHSTLHIWIIEYSLAFLTFPESILIIANRSQYELHRCHCTVRGN